MPADGWRGRKGNKGEETSRKVNITFFKGYAKFY